MARVAITGHRGLTKASEALIDAVLRAEIGRRPGELVGLTCLAEGADTLFARAVLDSGGRLRVVLPARRYRVGEADFDELVGRADTVITLDRDIPDDASYLAASLRMLADADELFAVWDGAPSRGLGGTAEVVDAARQLNLPVTVIWPVGAQLV
jgi:hypothetical protein